MRHATIRSADGTPLNLVQWDGGDRAQLLLVGGLAEHMGRYPHVARAFTDAGYAVAGIELRGHGHSGGKRGHVEDFADYRADVRAALDHVGPAFIIAHSMGGLVSTDTVLESAEGIRGWVMSNPLLGLKFEPPRWKVAGSRVLNRLLPRLSLSNELTTDWICRDPDVVARYEADPLVFDTVTPRWFMGSVRAQQRVFAGAARVGVPLLCLVGTDDKICNPESARRFVDACGSDDKALKVYDGLYHELFNEPEKEQVLADVIAWLDAHV